MRYPFFTRHPGCVTVLLVLLAAAGIGWYTRHAVLVSIAQHLVVVSQANAKAAALEAVHLYHAHLSPQIALTTWSTHPIDDELHRLGLLCLHPTEVARAILERGGVASDAIVVLSDPVDGTGTEMQAVVAFVLERRPQSLRLITARSHTARARWLLRRGLPPDIRVSVGSARFDAFSPTSWWQRREQTRDVMVEYLRWMNTLFLGDPWARRPPARSMLPNTSYGIGQW